MSHEVTSWFLGQVNQQFHTPGTVVRKFLIGTSDYGAYVLGWPTFDRRWDEVRPATITMRLSNAEQTFNFFRDDTTNLKKTCTTQLGFTHPTSGDEVIDVHEGEIVNVRYDDANVNISVADRFKQLTERLVGTRDTPEDFTGSNYLLTDIAWWACTSFGGLSALGSETNPDINWETFNDWADILSSTDNVRCQAHFDGLKCNQILRKIARMSDSAIYIKDNKIAFSRFTIIGSEISSMSAINIKKLRIDVSQQDIINRMVVQGGYNVSSDAFGFSVNDTSSDSVNSFGLHEEFEEDTNIWYVDSASAINYAERITTVKATPFDNFAVDGPLNSIVRQIGDFVSVEDPLLGISNTYRILGQNINMDQGAIQTTGNRTQVSNPFILDVSTLDGPDVLA